MDKLYAQLKLCIKMWFKNVYLIWVSVHRNTEHGKLNLSRIKFSHLMYPN